MIKKLGTSKYQVFYFFIKKHEIKNPCFFIFILKAALRMFLLVNS